MGVMRGVHFSIMRYASHINGVGGEGDRQRASVRFRLSSVYVFAFLGFRL
jgi:hypothetical protein